MFDIYCAHCGEAWDQDYLHNPEELDGPDYLTYKQAAAMFKTHGCGLFQAEPSPCKRPPIEPIEKLIAIKIGMDLSEYPDEWALVYGLR
jgi:hypothetical protein